MRVRIITWSLVAIATLGTIWLVYKHQPRQPVAVAKDIVAVPVSAAGGVKPSRAAPEPQRVLATLPTHVLATVNGAPIMLWDVMPVTTTNVNAVQQIDSVTYQYLLDRAINRQLITQAASARGIGLSEAQQQQLDKFRSERESSEPGLVAKLTVNPQEIEFELQDERAFMLQTSMMGAMGMSPNVTPEQVQQYYQAHHGDFAALPADPQARQETKAQIDMQIRYLLAANARTVYQTQLDLFMDQLKRSANIVITPLTEAAMNGPTRL